MNRKSIFGVAALALIAGSLAIAQTAKDPKDGKATKPAGDMPAGFQIPSDRTPEDFAACGVAAAPGAQHEYLKKSVGVWEGKMEMLMSPMSSPMTSTCTTTITSIMGDRYIQCDTKGDMGGMPFIGMGINGFDNVSGKFVGSWIDNMGTGIMNGTGEQSKDGKTINWNFTYNCPITKKPAIWREVDTHTGPNTMTLEMFTNDPKTGKEFRVMKIDYTKKS